MTRQMDLIHGSWNVLLILDACRADYFRELEPQAGTVDSMATITYLWIRKFIRETRDLDGLPIVYLTANPVPPLQHNSLKAGHVRMINIWQEAWTRLPDVGCDTVLPGDVNRLVRTYLDRHGQPARMVVHYLQPHMPHLGVPRIGFVTYNRRLNADPDITVNQALTRGLIPWDDVRRSYQANVELVYGYAMALASGLKGRVVITSDHGECLGEGKWFGHRTKGRPKALWRSSALRHVPWFEMDRGDFTPSTERPDDAALDVPDAKAKLKALGYL